MGYYEEHADAYIEKTKDGDFSSLYAWVTPRLKKGDSVLDVGFGSGRDLLFFQKQGYDAWGIDPVLPFVEAAKKLGLQVEQADIRTYTSKKKFQLVWANASLLHLPRKDFPLAFSSIDALLAPGGYFFLSMKEENPPRERIDELSRPLTTVSKEEVKSLPYSLLRLQEENDKFHRPIVWIDALFQKKGKPQ